MSTDTPSTDFQFTKTFLFLQQEGYLIQSSLLAGLDHLRNARLDTKGHFYTAFFQLSIGIERLMKTTFIVNFMRENANKTPAKTELKDNFRHGLCKLFNKLRDLSLPGQTNPLKPIAHDSIELQMLRALNDFAQEARYHNLDSLANSAPYRDPLETWNDIIERVLRDDVKADAIARILGQSHFLTESLGSLATVIGTDMKKNPLNMLRAFSLPGLHDLAAGHVVFHMLVLLRSLATQLDDVCTLILTDPKHSRSDPMPVPHMHEFFSFVHYDKRQVLKKRRWK
jgi:hypothetical protein